MPEASVTAPKLPNDNSVTSAVTPLNDNTVNTPLPAGIEAPVNENPSTVLPPVDTVKPAASAAPSDAPVKAKPVTSTWKPATSPPKSYKISKLPAESNAPRLNEAKQLDPSPSHTPQSSKAESPKHTPAQS